MASPIDAEIFDAEFLGSGLLQRYRLPGFKIKIVLEPGDSSPIVKAFVHVRAAIYFDSTATVTYRAVISQSKSEQQAGSLTSDQLIVLAGMPAGVEHWHVSDVTGREEMDLQVSKCRVNCLQLAAGGVPSKLPLEIEGTNEVMVSVFQRYREYLQQRVRSPVMSSRNATYVFIDIWEDLGHSAGLRFSRLASEGVIDHIRRRHQRELIGLLTLYPYEWRYRDAAAYERICGQNIAIDTDDLVLVNENVALVIGTYGRRGKGSPTDWKAVVRATRYTHHVSWPEYLHVWELVIAKLHAVRAALHQLQEAVPDIEQGASLKKILRSTSGLSLNMIKMMIDLDAIGFARFASSKAMYKVTERRLGLKDELGALSGRLSQFDTSIKNIDTLEELQRSQIIRGLLAFITVASICQILFQDLNLPLVQWIVDPAAVGDATVATRAAIVVLIGVTVTVAVMAFVSVLRWGIWIFGKLRKKLRRLSPGRFS